MSRSNSRLACLSGLGLAGIGLAHFTSPHLFGSITKPAFPRRTRQHIWINGGIETILGLCFSVRWTRGPAIVGLVAYLVYLGGNVKRNFRTA